MVNDDKQTVLISLPSGLIKSKGTNVNLKGNVTITINGKGTVLYDLRGSLNVVPYRKIPPISFSQEVCIYS